MLRLVSSIDSSGNYIKLNITIMYYIKFIQAHVRLTLSVLFLGQD
jgi:hypothetical protein